MRLHDCTGNATNGTKVSGVFPDLLPSMVQERSSVRSEARWIDGEKSEEERENSGKMDGGQRLNWTTTIKA